MTKATKWPGLISNADPHDLPPGAATVQENFTCVVPGKLTGRKGLRMVSFTNMDPAVSEPTTAVLEVFAMHNATGQTVLMLLADGTVRYGRSPI
jgi:hypothetical protein